MKKLFLLLTTICLIILFTACQTANIVDSSSLKHTQSSSTSTKLQSTSNVSASSEVISDANTIVGFIGDGTAMSVVTVDTEDGCSYMFRMDDVYKVITGDVVYGASVIVKFEGELTPNDTDNITVTSFAIDNSKNLPQDANQQSLRKFYGTVCAESSSNTLIVLAGNGNKYSFDGLQDVEVTGNTQKGLVEGTEVVITYTGQVNQYEVENELYISCVTMVSLEIK